MLLKWPRNYISHRTIFYCCFCRWYLMIFGKVNSSWVTYVDYLKPVAILITLKRIELFFTQIYRGIQKNIASGPKTIALCINWRQRQQYSPFVKILFLAFHILHKFHSYLKISGFEDTQVGIPKIGDFSISSFKCL